MAVSEWKHLMEMLDDAQFYFSDLFALVGATYLTKSWENEPLWIHVIGPPSSGKTFTIKQFEHLPNIKIVSALTPASLISGFGGEKIDVSLLAEMNDRLLVSKDFGTILSMGYDSSKEIFSILREAFDGHVAKNFGTMRREYFPHFNFIAASTEACESYGMFRVQLGERFLRYHHKAPELPNPPPTVNRALPASIAAWMQEKEKTISEATTEVSEEAHATVTRISACVAKLRTEVIHRGGGDEVLEVPGFEGPFRLANQLLKLYKGLYAFTGDTEYSQLLLKKVSSCAMKPRRAKTLQLLIEEPRQTLDIISELRLGGSVIRRVLNDLYTLNILERTMITFPKTYVWSIAPNFQEDVRFLLETI